VRELQRLAVIIVACGLFYGACMGTSAGISGDRWLQVLYSALKVPLLLAVTFSVSVPSFFMMNTLLGLRDDFWVSLRALAATQAAVSSTLASLAPFTLLWYASSSHYLGAILFNVAMFAIATLTGQRLLAVHYKPLIAKNERHRQLLFGWLFVFALVAIQMSWMLRPFIGDPNSPVTFFRQDGWSNAYEMLASLIFRMVTSA
jgi:hypothetical protein